MPLSQYSTRIHRQLQANLLLSVGNTQPDACLLHAQNPATQAQAEQTLLQFRRSSGILPACRHILEHSHNAEARFHAACALREALLREWATHTAEERNALRTYLLRYVLVHAAESQLHVVRSILEGTLAVMLKRGWMETSPEARAAFFQVGWGDSQGSVSYQS